MHRAMSRSPLVFSPRGGDIVRGGRPVRGCASGVGATHASPLPVGHQGFVRTGVVLVALVMGCARGGPADRSGAGLPARFDIGRPATPAEIEAWDVDVRGDGRGLPPGSGTVAEGAVVYAARCAICHGVDGTHPVAPPTPPLVGRIPGDAFPFATDTTAALTVGNYWPFAPTIYDYTHRSMPLAAPGSMTPHDVYAVTAFILERNGIVPTTFVANAQTLPQVQMPARNRFVADDRTGGSQLR
jgi:S-disulfanyl-L-cysteine oxidoreductase SoxD